VARVVSTRTALLDQPTGKEEIMFTVIIGAFEPEDFEAESAEWKEQEFGKYITFTCSEYGEAKATTPDRGALAEFILWYCNDDLSSAVSMALDVTIS
jgi:hypothetical protein